ncbi:MAG: T9SS type A sorting domain-containing protein [Saprospiraceae bacterium]|nr:T9SS type A sorting domain-containing protein [Saprospiraceae bacterium]
MMTKRADRPVLIKVAALSVIMFMLAVVGEVKGQGWEVSFGGTKEDQGKALLQTRDGGFLIAGFSESFGGDNDIDVYLIRTDVEGKIIWSQVYDEGFIEHAYDVIETEDGGFLIVGDINTIGTQPSVYLLKVNENGKQEWSRQYGNAATSQRGEEVVKAVDGGYVIVGRTNETTSGKFDILLIKVTENGNEVWSKTYGGAKDDEGRAIVAFQGGYVFTGISDNNLPGSFDRDIVVYKVNAQGDVLKFFRDSTIESEEAYDIIVTKDGGILVAGEKYDNSDFYLLKLRDTLSTVFAKAHDVNDFGDKAFAVVELNDGSFVVTGITEVDDQNLGVLLAKCTPNGEVMWTRGLGERKRTDYGEAVVATNDGGFAVVGYTALGDLAFINDVLLIKTDPQGNTITNFIAGQVYYDKDGACDFDPADEPLKEWLIRVDKTTGENKTYFGTTDENGRYKILVDTGRYNVKVLPVNDYWESCISGGYNINLTNFYDTTSLNFPAFVAQACPYLEVDVSTPFLAVCADVEYTVAYCNVGTAKASDAYVEVTLDDKLTYISSTGITPTSQNGNVYRYNLGDLEISECGSFTIQTKMGCEGIAIGQAALVSAHIYPDTVCLEPGPEWDGSSIIVSGRCEQDTVSFRISNIGRNDMTRPSRYYIVQDVVILRNAVPFQLQSQEDESISLPSNGATYRLIAEQAVDHPGRSYPTVAVEGCAENGQSISTGYVLQFPEDDRDNFVDIDVQEVVGLTQKVEMRGYPKGYQDSLIAANTEITYKIFFKNTETDTVSRVVIRDTLPESLDIATFVKGSSSHPYSYEIYGDGVLKITLEDVQLLPNGSVDETSNWGFVNFRIAQKPNNPTKTTITNDAAVYFDYDAPVMTNEVTHVVAQFPDFLVSVTPGPVFMPDVRIKVYPNPFVEFATFEIEGRDFGKVNFSLFDVMGRSVESKNFVGNQFKYYRNQNIPAGAYTFRLESEGQLISSGKLIMVR